MRTPFVTTALLGSLLAGLGACGQLEGDTDRAPVIATIHGQLSNPDGYAAGANMRVAIVWGAETGDVRVSQDVPVEAVFPSQFRLELRELPPADAMRAFDDRKDAPQPGAIDCAPGYDPSSGKPAPGPSTLCDSDAPPAGGGEPTPSPSPSPGTSRIQDDDWRAATPSDPFKIAVGTLVAYEDLNANGQLDLLDVSATQAVDRVVGVNRDLFVVYAEGTPTGDLAKVVVKPGFSLLQANPCPSSMELDQEPTAGTPEEAPASSTCSDVPVSLAIDTLFTLPLTASPQLGQFMCKGGGGLSSVSSGGGIGGQSPAVGGGPTAPQPESYPLPSDPSLHCKADGTGYVYAQCDTPTLCGDTVCSSERVDRPDQLVTDWPCPAR
jgi:hypothetical protein